MKKYLIVIYHGRGYTYWQKINDKECPANSGIYYKKISMDKGYEIIAVNHYDAKIDSGKVEEILKNCKIDVYQDEVLVFAHKKTDGAMGLDESGKKELQKKGINVYLFAGDTKDFAYTKIIVPICNMINNKSYEFPTWEEIKKEFEPNWLEIILSPLLPLHLSLQAFWGISIVQGSGSSVEFVKFGERPQDSDEVLKEIYEERDEHITRTDTEVIDPQFVDIFPNPDAFLLVDDALWDFYAPLFDKTIHKCGEELNKESFNCEDEEKEYVGDNFAVLIGNRLKRGEDKEGEGDEKEGGPLEKLKETFNKRVDENFTPCDDCLKDTATRAIVFFQLRTPPSAGSLNITYGCFVSCLREIAAILANTYDKNDSKCHKKIEVDSHEEEKKKIDSAFAYKGRCGVKKNEILGKIWSKEESELKQTWHCKLPDKGDKPTDKYSVLKKQIAAWGIKKAMVVIAGIEKLAKCLDECIKESGELWKE